MTCDVIITQADVIVAPPNRVHRNRPYTVQTGQCGDPGTHIHLTPEYLLDDKYVEDFGPKSEWFYSDN